MHTLLFLALVACGGSSQPATTPEVTASKPVTPTVARTLAQVSVDELKKRIDSGEKIHLVDVRTVEEVSSGVVPGAVVMPLDDYKPSTPPVSTTPKDVPIFFICESGGRSKRAAEITAAAGFTAVNVEGGTAAWRAAEYPLEQLVEGQK